VRIRLFDNIAEALAGQKPGNCTMHEACDSYVVVEYNGDVYRAISSSRAPGSSATYARLLAGDRAPHPPFHLRCQEDAGPSRLSGVPVPVHLPRWMPKLRHGPHGRFEDLDYFCQAYKTIFARSVEPLRAELRKLRVGEPAGLDGR